MMDLQGKPHDLGNGLLCASFAVGGSWLSVSAVHPDVGLVELSGAPVFPPEHDGRVDAVRAHRARLADPATAMLRVVASRPEPVSEDGGWYLRGDGWRARVVTAVEDTAPALEQRYLVSAAAPGALRLVLRGRLDRPGYAEVTPGGPIPPSLPPHVVEVDGSTLKVHSRLGGVVSQARIEVTCLGVFLDGWHVDDEGAWLEVSWSGSLTAVPLLVRLAMSCLGGTGSQRAEGWRAGLPRTVPTRLADAGMTGIERAAVGYTLGCTALEVADGECCILTDHRLLPLSWTRDAYYQAALLLAQTAALPEAEAVVERHLTWLWRSGRDADGVWRRSHLSTGAVKDSGHQVDQQLFPLLELVDFRRSTGRWPRMAAGTWGDEVRRVWRDLSRDAYGLVPGEENPADDPSELPYLLSSQLLLVYVARRLEEFTGELGTANLDLDADVARTLEGIRSTFTCPGPFGDQWAYEADGVGGHRLYHDANDVPTALAPLWGLCADDDPHWRATMRFGFSTHNPGYVDGTLPGLGSAHTPGVWPLGDAQEWAVAVARGDAPRIDAVIARMTQVASTDGMLPESYDPHTGDWLSRHWFAWPGSLAGLLHATFDHGRGPWVAEGP